jgi:hypothetical protein
VHDGLVEIANGFWNIRGSFRVLGVDLGTQSSLARLRSGQFVLLDCIPFGDAALTEIRRRTDGGAALEAIVNLHPFHTLHVAKVAGMFPDATLYGTARHHRVAPTLRWSAETTEGEAFAARYAEDFDLLVPRGVDFVPDNENLHFASVLAIHRQTETLHVDDTLSYLPIPGLRRLMLHPALGDVLQRRKGAAQEFRAWAAALIERCKTVEHTCTAHMRLPPPGQFPSIADEVRKAVHRVERKLARHEQLFG